MNQMERRKPCSAVSRLSPVLIAGFAVMVAVSAADAQLKGASMPDFGPNVLVFRPSMPAHEIQAQIDKIYAVQEHNEFGVQRNAMLFLPGEYHVNVPVGFYTRGCRGRALA